MTSEQLCECSADELDKLSFVQLEEYFKPFWPTTRPERKARDEEQGSLISKQTIQPRQPRSSKSKATNARDVALENKLSPERLKWLKDNGLL